MPAPSTDLDRLRTAVDEFLAHADRCGAQWTTPVRPGKWSPSQILEHVARALEESARDMQGHRSKLPQLPAPARFLARHLVFRRVMRNSALPRAKTNRAMSPREGPATPQAGRERLEMAWRAFEESRGRMTGPVDSRVFGTVPLDDYVRFQELHMRHHCAQLPTA